MQIKTWKNFSKRKNSTLLPAEASAVTHTVKLLNDTSIENPSFILKSNDYEINYVQAFGHYYYVSNITFLSNDLMQLDCIQDVLATYKSAIGNTSAYVLRSASAYNTKLMDDLFPMTNNLSIASKKVSSPFVSLFANGSFIIGILNADTNHAGYYCMTYSQYNAFKSYLFTFDYGIIENVEKALFNPMKYIVSLKWLPVDIDDIKGAPLSTIKYGFWDMNLDGTACYSVGASKSITFDIDIPKHPQASSYGSFMNMVPFSRYMAYIPCFGCVPIDTTYLANESKLKGKILIDTRTGEAELNLRVLPNALADITIDNYGFYYAHTQLGVDIPLAQITSDVVRAGSHLIAATSSGIYGNASGVIANLFSSAVSMIPQVESMIQTGAIAFSFEQFTLTAFFMDIVPIDAAHVGRPLCESRTISALSGYVLCKNASVSIDGMEADREEINNYLNGGFYYE